MENYIKYPKFILQSLPFGKIRSTEIYILHTIIEFTYGYHKKYAWIAISSFSKKTKIDKRNVRRSLKKLEAMDAITIKIEDKKHKYSINESFFKKLNSKKYNSNNEDVIDDANVEEDVIDDNSNEDNEEEVIDDNSNEEEVIDESDNEISVTYDNSIDEVIDDNEGSYVNTKGVSYDVRREGVDDEQERKEKKVFKEREKNECRKTFVYDSFDHESYINKNLRYEDGDINEEEKSLFLDMVNECNELLVYNSEFNEKASSYIYKRRSKEEEERFKFEEQYPYWKDWRFRDNSKIKEK